MGVGEAAVHSAVPAHERDRNRFYTPARRILRAVVACREREGGDRAAGLGTAVVTALVLAVRGSGDDLARWGGGTSEAEQ